MQNDEQEYLNAFRGKKDAEPTQDAAEGENDTPAVAVVIDAKQAVDDAATEAGLPEGQGAEGEVAQEAAAEGEPVAQEAAEEGGEEVSPEDMQRQKSWEGRLRKREEELAAREASIGQSQSEVVGDEEIAEIQERMSGDFGEEFVKDLMKLLGFAARKAMQEGISSHVNPIQETIAQAINDVQEAFKSLHLSAIADAHEDFQEIVDSEQFSAFMNELPEDQKANATQVIESGTPKQVIALLNQYKASLTPAEQNKKVDTSIDDALDAASGVRSSSPVQLPSAAPVGSDDEYKAAWDSM